MNTSSSLDVVVFGEKEAAVVSVSTEFLNADRAPLRLESADSCTVAFASRDVPVTPTFGNRGYGNDSTDREDVVNQYLCEVEYPARPRPPLTPTQLGYLYDYFVQFKAPCLQGLGYELMPPTNAPSKDVFVTDWPRQGWNPSPVTGLDAEAAAVELACPSYPDGLR